jgi:NADPH-dependent 2,4-dienoyl-CoA reductase/sulfur reductase-like enzyme
MRHGELLGLPTRRPLTTILRARARCIVDRLPTPSPALSNDSYEAIVVGSGFGGAVAACRLAQASVQLALLERGRRFEPGSFPRPPRAYLRRAIVRRIDSLDRDR